MCMHPANVYLHINVKREKGKKKDAGTDLVLNILKPYILKYIYFACIS